MRLSCCLVLVAPMVLASNSLNAQAPALDSVRAILRVPTFDSTATARKRAQATAYARAQVTAAPNDPWSHRALSAAASVERDYDTAVAEAQRAVALAPQVSSHYVTLSNALFNKAGAVGGLGAMGLAKDGKAAAEKAVALDPNDLDARETLIGFHLEAPGIAGGDKEEALKQAREIARRNPVRGSAALLRVANSTNDENDLVYRFEQALRLISSGHDSINILRNTLVNLTGQVKSDALKERFANRLYVALPNDTIVRYARARLWIVQGQHLPEAAAIFQAYLTYPQPPANGVGFAAVHWRLGQVYEKLGRDAEALAEYDRSVAIVPHPASADTAATRMKRKLGK